MSDRSKVLVVDDEPNLAQLLREWLEEEGHEVYSATEGREALPCTPPAHLYDAWKCSSIS